MLLLDSSRQQHQPLWCFVHFVQGHVDVVAFLLANRANVGTRVAGATALTLAAQEGKDPPDHSAIAGCQPLFEQGTLHV